MFINMVNRRFMLQQSQYWFENLLTNLYTGGKISAVVESTLVESTLVESTLAHRDEFTTAGTYTWTCPDGVTFAIVTVAAGGGGGVYVEEDIDYLYDWNTNEWISPGDCIHGCCCKAKNGEVVTHVVQTVPGTEYTITVGAGGEGVYEQDIGTNFISKHTDGESSSAFGVTAEGGGIGAWLFAIFGVISLYPPRTYDGQPIAPTPATSKDDIVGSDGWVYIEYS